ncbi:MAG: hypothetical protein RhofKO_01720 [Rhodothermales bacterium]
MTRRLRVEQTQRGTRLVVGVGALWLADVGLAAGLDAVGVRFSSAVAGMLLVFGALLAFERVRPGACTHLDAWFQPAYDFLGRWMALFFVPPLALVHTNHLGTLGDIAKVALVLMVGYVFTVVSTAYLAKGLARDASVEAENSMSPQPILRLSEQSLLVVWLLVLAGSGGLLAATGWIGFQVALLTAVAVAAFIGGSLGRAAIEQRLRGVLRNALLAIVHPVVVSAAAVGGFLSLGPLPISAYQAVEGWSAYAVLMAFLNPSVWALGFRLYHERVRLKRHAVTVVVSLSAAAMLAMVSSAVLARVLGLGPLLSKALIPRTVTTPIAIPIAEVLGGEPGLTAAFVIITGVLGALIGVTILNALGLRDPTSRGLAMGASAGGIGTAALVAREPAAAALSGIGFALLATFSALFISIAPIREFVLWLVGL